MNIYTFSFTLPGSTEATTLEVRGRNETEAKKNFKASDYGKLSPLSSVEVSLSRENVMATKQEERDTLEAIRQMVAELGEGSYLATAFEGVFADAESNIENDFGDSMKRRWESAEEKLSVAQKKIEELETQKRLMQETIDRLKQENEALEARKVTGTDLAHLIRLAEEDLAAAQQRRDDAAQKIVAYADCPASEYFQQAVTEHRNALSSIEAKEMRLGRLNSIKVGG